MNILASVIIVAILLNSLTIEINTKEQTEATHDQVTTDIPDGNDDNYGEESSTTPDDGDDEHKPNTNLDYGCDASGDEIYNTTRLNRTRCTNFLDEFYCKNCIKNGYGDGIVNICVNYFQVVLFSSPENENSYIRQGSYMYNDGELVNVICANTGNNLPTLITMTYYEREGSSLKQTFTSTALNSVQSYIKLLRKNSNSYVDCKFKIGVQPVVDTARLVFIPKENTTAVVKVNGLTLSELCTTLNPSPLYVYEYYANYKEELNLTMTLDKDFFYGNKYCKVYGDDNTMKWHFLENNKTKHDISLDFGDTASELKLDCFAESSLSYNFHHNKTFEVHYIAYSHILEYEMYLIDIENGYGNGSPDGFLWLYMIIEGLEWSKIIGIGIYLSESSTKTVRYLYHGEELQLKCIAYSIPNWEYSDKIIYTNSINNVQEEYRTSNRGGNLYSAISKFKVKETHSHVTLSCTLSFGHAIVVELIRNETDLMFKKLVEPNNKSTKESFSVVQTTTIAVTALVIVLLIVAFTVFKVVKVRNQRKPKEVRMVYGRNNVENIYESVVYGNANSNAQPSVDISQRPPLPLPLEEEEENKPYIHYDTPYEYRLFRFGRRPRPPNRGRVVKRID